MFVCLFVADGRPNGGPIKTKLDGVAHSKNPRKCVYHVTFHLDLDLEHTLDAC